ncbi:MAG: ATP-binding cassette domain-containing protein [Bdellovibrionales bacterium]|nr:ATP-binding cassette domain-containing protein [Bdellovibrionales bacterium]
MSQLVLRNLSVNYYLEEQAIPVLREVHLSIESGEMVAILGPSGSGKPTLLYILGCLLKPSSGSYQFQGRDVFELNQIELAELKNKHFGFIFQQFHLLPRTNLIQNLLLGTRYNHWDNRSQKEWRNRALDLLNQMGLESHLEYHPHQLSGGQQQRVAIARALINNPSVLLADEPTGNLDSKNAANVLDLLRSINRSGKTVIIITHDLQVSQCCDRVINVLDGKVFEKVPPKTRSESSSSPAPLLSHRSSSRSRWNEDCRTAWQNILRNKSRSILTMLGIIIGVAAVLATMTLGTYTREKILETYESLGVNKLVVRAYPNWQLKATEAVGTIFDGFDEGKDLETLRRLFRDIIRISPVVSDCVQSVTYAGKSVEPSRIFGVNREYLSITNRNVLQGQPFTHYHVKNRSAVCLIGYEISKQIFGHRSPLEQRLQINRCNQSYFSCRVIGVLNSQKSNNDWEDPNKQILLPFSFLLFMGDRWNISSNEFNLTTKPGTPLETLGKKIKYYFQRKYGKSAVVYVDSDEILVAQMRHFLNLFNLLLTGVALISLTVGGIGIANMMLVSVSERFKEIGLRKALGASENEIRNQFLVESLFICGIAGIIGIGFGIVGYHLVLFFASKFLKQVQFEFVFNWASIFFAFCCIFTVGILSGLVPALRAQKLEVIEALRSE